MKIGDVATRLGIAASTIRYYEQEGLIEPQRRISGRREFDERALFALEFIRLAQAAGFTIAETKTLLEAYSKDPSAAGAWHDQAQKKQQEVRAQIAQLGQVDAILTELVSCQCDSLTQCIETGIAKYSAAKRTDD